MYPPLLLHFLVSSHEGRYMHQMGAFFSRSINVSAKVIALSSLTGAVLGAVRASPDTLWSDIWTGALTGFVISLFCLLAEY